MFVVASVCVCVCVCFESVRLCVSVYVSVDAVRASVCEGKSLRVCVFVGLLHKCVRVNNCYTSV